MSCGHKKETLYIIIIITITIEILSQKFSAVIKKTFIESATYVV
jgi:hypothetical protein